VAAGALPNLLVIGAAKCGTSSLHYYLGLHPEVQMSQPKELQFLISDEDLDSISAAASERELSLLRERSNAARGTDWYRGFFEPDAPIRGESSVAYGFPWYGGVAERAAELVPDAKLIYLVRDPLDRAISHYLQYADLREWRPLDDALSSPGNPYVRCSLYASVLDPFLRHFPRSAIHVVEQRHLREARRQTMAGIFSFLGVDPAFWSPEMETMRNLADAKGTAFRMAERLRAGPAGAPLRRLPTGLKLRLERLLARSSSSDRRPAPAPETRARLESAFDGDISQLEELTGWNLDHWRGGSLRTHA
jgi:hypothetical protein